MQAPLEIKFRELEPSTALTTRIRELATRLERFFDRIQFCEVAVELPHRHHRQGRQYHVRIKLDVPGTMLVVSNDPGPDEAHEDIYVALRDAFDAARRQLEDYVRGTLRGKVGTAAQTATRR
jgi:ribosome-associated translation inhibitor RaiA